MNLIGVESWIHQGHPGVEGILGSFFIANRPKSTGEMKNAKRLVDGAAALDSGDILGALL